MQVPWSAISQSNLLPILLSGVWFHLGYPLANAESICLLKMVPIFYPLKYSQVRYHCGQQELTKLWACVNLWVLVYLCALCTEQDSENCPNGGGQRNWSIFYWPPAFLWLKAALGAINPQCCCQVWSCSWEGDRKGQRISGVSNWATFHRNVGKWALAYLVETGHRWRGCLFIPGCPGLSFLGGSMKLTLGRLRNSYPERFW